MKFVVYVRTNRSYLLVPDSLAGVEYIHGRLSYCDTIDTDMYPLPELWAAVTAEVDAYSYAAMPEMMGRELLSLRTQLA
ncbi:MAG TPA: hypothetical protein VJ484_11205 [Lysobacter sp.]|nr:hypothetical protein [Lysobacter sp.]